jgi:hypothetical protein
MFVFLSVNESRGMLWHLVHDLIYIKINKMAAFSPISLVHIVGLRGISFSLFTKPSDGEHKEPPVQRPASNNNNNNNAHLEQLLTTQTQLMQAMLQTLNNMQPNQRQVPPLPPPHQSRLAEFL